MKPFTEFEIELIERELARDIETTQVFNMIGNYNSLKRLAQGLYKRVRKLEKTEFKGDLIKVVGFPPGEAMWVEIVEGDWYEGWGLLQNDPVLWEGKMGDTVHYWKGTDKRKPTYKGKRTNEQG